MYYYMFIFLSQHILQCFVYYSPISLREFYQIIKLTHLMLNVIFFLCFLRKMYWICKDKRLLDYLLWSSSLMNFNCWTKMLHLYVRRLNIKAILIHKQCVCILLYSPEYYACIYVFMCKLYCILCIKHNIFS